MTEDRIHRATSEDGTQVTAHVHGQGPPLILLPAGPADAETTWHYALPYLSESFTCHLLNTRGRGLSADHPDHSPERMIEDIRAFAESIGGPVALVEWGSFVGASWSLVAAQGSSSVSAVATYDPLVLEVASEQDAAQIQGIFERIAELATDGRLTDAARTFVEAMATHGYYTEEDMADGAAEGLWGASLQNIPMFVQELDVAESEGTVWTQPATLAATTVPVLLLHGARSHPMNIEFVHYVADHLADPHVREVADAGHYGPHTQAEAIAREIMRFLEPALVRA